MKFTKLTYSKAYWVKYERERQWHTHWAWWPTRINDTTIIWCETILRLKEWDSVHWRWIYKENVPDATTNDKL